MLVEHKALLDASDVRGETALVLAAQRNKADVVEALLNAKVLYFGLFYWDLFSCFPLVLNCLELVFTRISVLAWSNVYVLDAKGYMHACTRFEIHFCL